MRHPIRLLILDVDGVLTDGTIAFHPDGSEYKLFHAQDGYGMTKLQQFGIPIAIISGRSSTAVTRRMQELNIQHVYQGVSDKLPLFHQLIQDLQINPLEVAYVGDDLPDLPIMELVGYKIAVSNATPPILAAADWCTQRSGGQGAVREVCDWILSQFS